MKHFHIFAVLVLVIGGAILWSGFTESYAMVKGSDLMSERPEEHPTATFAGGCFWCTESEYRAINGVLFTRVGYMGGETDDPSYRDITTGRTGHAEVVQVTYDPEKLPYKDLVEFFLVKAHDPTQLNRQGVDVGTQYRSAIFYANEAEKQAAQEVIEYVEDMKVYKKPIVTTLEPLQTFWDGEEYHQQYYEKYEAETGKPHIRVIMKQGKKR